MPHPWYLLVFSTSFAVRCFAQSCPLPPAQQTVPRKKNIFSDQRESDLGNIRADSLFRDETVVQDDVLSAHLRDVTSRVARYLPENRFRLQFAMIELPEANAFSYPEEGCTFPEN